MIGYKYEVVANILREDIRHGKFPGGELPDEASLMKRFKVGKITVYNALKLLSQEGILKRIKSKGTFISGTHGKSLTISGQVAIVMSTGFLRPDSIT